MNWYFNYNLTTDKISIKNNIVLKALINPSGFIKSNYKAGKFFQYFKNDAMGTLKNTGLKFLLVLSFIFIQQSYATACEIYFEIIGNQKEIYKAGDVLEIRMTVELTHRQCPEGLKSTKFDLENVAVLSSTEWLNLGNENWEKTMKVRLLHNDTGEAAIIALRECNREGGCGELILKTTK